MNFGALLSDVIARLDAARVAYMVTGSLASSFHGEPRATRDVDIVIDPDAAGLGRLIDALVDGGYGVDRDVASQALVEHTQFNAIDPSAVKVDFIIRKDRPFSIEEFGRKRPGPSIHHALGRDPGGFVRVAGINDRDAGAIDV